MSIDDLCEILEIIEEGDLLGNPYSDVQEGNVKLDPDFYGNNAFSRTHGRYT